MRLRLALLSHSKAWGQKGLYGYPIEMTYVRLHQEFVSLAVLMDV
jgi:hypothetical protein